MIYSPNPALTPIRQADVQPVGIVPLVAAAWIGAGMLATGTAGYFLGRPTHDVQGNPLPGPIDRAAGEVGRGIGNAITLLAAVAAGYYIFLREEPKRRKRS